MNFENLLGSVVQSGMSRSSSDRMRASLGGGDMLGSLAGMLGGASGGSSQGGALGGMLGNILNEAGRAVGGNNNLALGGLGALAGALLGGGKRSLGGALGGGVMAMLGIMAFQALKGRVGQQAKVPLGLAAPQTAAQRAELERNSELVLRAMINAAKSDGRIDGGEIRRILGKVHETGADDEAREFLGAELDKPVETAKLVAAARGQPELAAQLYGASLLAIEVDTEAEKEYLRQLADALGLEPQVTQNLHQAVGLLPA